MQPPASIDRARAPSDAFGMKRTVLVLAVACASRLAAAQDKPEGTRLFDEGRELAKAGRYEEACAKFDDSLALDHAAGTALNYGDCLEKLGQLRKAWRMFDDAATLFDRTHDPRAAYARERAAAVDVKLATVVVKVADPTRAELVIRIGEESVPPAAQIVARVEPGEVEVSATAPGRTPFRQRARGVAGQRVIVEIPALAATAVAAPREPVHVEASPGRRDRTRVKLAYGLGGVGAASLVGSLALGLIARSQYNRAVDEECTPGAQLLCSADGVARVDAASTKANIATGLAIGGGALVLAGAILYVTAPREHAVTPTATASSIGLAFSGRF
jgi:tetratricopeptide (TPR) repeat protein